MGQSLPFLVTTPRFNLAPLLCVTWLSWTGPRKAKKEGGGGGGYLAFSPDTRRRPRRPRSGQVRCTPGGPADNGPFSRLLDPYSPAAKKAKKRASAVHPWGPRRQRAVLAPSRPVLAGGQEGQEAGKCGAPLGAPPTTGRSRAFSARTRRRPRRPRSGQVRCTPGGPADNGPFSRLLAPYSPAAKKAKKRASAVHPWGPRRQRAVLAPSRPVLAGGQEGQEAGKCGAPLGAPPTTGRSRAFSARTRRRPRRPRSGQVRCTPGGPADNGPFSRLLGPYSPAAKKAKKRASAVHSQASSVLLGPSLAFLGPGKKGQDLRGVLHSWGGGSRTILLRSHPTSVK